jgi:hypothetical protein
MYLNLSLNPRPYCQSGCKEKPIFLAFQMFGRLFGIISHTFFNHLIMKFLGGKEFTRYEK